MGNYLNEYGNEILLFLLVSLAIALVFFLVMKKTMSHALNRQLFYLSYNKVFVEICVYFLGEDSIETVENRAFEERYHRLNLLEFEFRLQYFLSRYEEDKTLRKTEEYETLASLESFIKNHQTSELVSFVQEVSKEIKVGRKKSRRSL